LLACLQGLRGTVSARPPFPAERGVHGRPTVVNNIETLANMPFIAEHGAAAYAALSPDSDQRLQAGVLQRALHSPDDLRGPVRDVDADAV
jgi:NADH:ubiquinone oxidoreductase subunit F (NADH-binding)